MKTEPVARAAFAAQISLVALAVSAAVPSPSVAPEISAVARALVFSPFVAQAWPAVLVSAIVFSVVPAVSPFAPVSELVPALVLRASVAAAVQEPSPSPPVLAVSPSLVIPGQPLLEQRIRESETLRLYSELE